LIGVEKGNLMSRHDLIRELKKVQVEKQYTNFQMAQAIGISERSYYNVLAGSLALRNYMRLKCEDWLRNQNGKSTNQ